MHESIKCCNWTWIVFHSHSFYDLVTVWWFAWLKKKKNVDAIDVIHHSRYKILVYMTRYGFESNIIVFKIVQWNQNFVKPLSMVLYKPLLLFVPLSICLLFFVLIFFLFSLFWVKYGLSQQIAGRFKVSHISCETCADPHVTELWHTSFFFFSSVIS